MGRWYDKDGEFAEQIEKLRDAEESVRDRWVKDILGMMQRTEPDCLSTDKLLDFPLKMFRRRWYDSDPYLWMLMNILPNLQDSTQEEIKKYLIQQ